jgi:hypothetical protein
MLISVTRFKSDAKGARGSRLRGTVDKAVHSTDARRLLTATRLLRSLISDEKRVTGWCRRLRRIVDNQNANHAVAKLSPRSRDCQSPFKVRGSFRAAAAPFPYAKPENLMTIVIGRQGRTHGRREKSGGLLAVKTVG